MPVDFHEACYKERIFICTLRMYVYVESIVRGKRYNHTSIPVPGGVWLVISEAVENKSWN